MYPLKYCGLDEYCRICSFKVIVQLLLYVNPDIKKIRERFLVKLNIFDCLCIMLHFFQKGLVFSKENPRNTEKPEYLGEFSISRYKRLLLGLFLK